MDTEKLNKTVAIDFGTTNSVGGIFKNNNIAIIPSNEYGDQGSALIPSFVEYRERGVVVGRAAKNNFGKKNKFVIAAVKRIIGQRYEEYERLNDKTIFGCEVVRGDDGYPRFVVSEDGRRVSAIEVASEIFKVMKKRADEYGEREFSEAYVTVPANFKDHQCKAIKKAAEIAGLKVLKLITEPTAAAMSWCFDHADELSIGQRMIVYDFGGGTFDVSHVQYIGKNRFRVRTVDGNPNLGGNDIDSALMDSIIELYYQKTGINLVDGKPRAVHKFKTELRHGCEDIKILMTNDCTYDDDKDNFYNINRRMRIPVAISTMNTKLEPDDDIDLSPKVFDRAIEKKIDETIDITQQLIGREGLMVGNVRYFFLVGGSSKLTMVKRKLKSIFSNSFFPVINAEESVAKGAMKLLINDCSEKPGNPVVEQPIVTSYGLASSGDDVAIILKRGQRIPVLSNDFEFTTTEDRQKHVDSMIYQWVGDPKTLPEKNGVPIANRLDCTEVDHLVFDIEDVKPKGEKKLAIRFYLEEGGTLEVVCRDMDVDDILKDISYVVDHGGHIS